MKVTVSVHVLISPLHLKKIGEAHYSLLGQPLQYKPSIRPPLIHTAHVVAKHQVCVTDIEAELLIINPD